MTTEVDSTLPDVATDDQPTRIALKTGASAGPEDIDGYCENGAGVYLSTADDEAELMLYAVTPAETVTFERPALQLTTERSGRQTMEVTEFETVTLHAGESWLLTEQADGTLMDVVAELDARVTPAL